MSVSQMKKLTVLAERQDADRLVRRLMRLRCAEIRTLSPDDGDSAAYADRLRRADSDTARVEAERRVADVSTAMALLGDYAPKAKLFGKPHRPSAEAFVAAGRDTATRAAVAKTLALRDERVEAETEYNRLASLRTTLFPWLDMDAPPGLASTDLCEVWAGTFSAALPLSQVDDALSPFHAGVEEVSRDKETLYAVILCHVCDREGIARALADLGFLRTAFKGLPLEAGSIRENDAYCEARLAELEAAKEAVLAATAEMGTLLPDMEVLYDIEMTTLIAARQRQKLLTTERCVILDAWIPADRLSRVTSALDDEPCAYDLADPDEGDEPPILLRNNGFASNFEWVVGMYAYPRYGTYDPTMIMSIFYFFMFGIMFADVGYGALLLLGGFLLPRVMDMKDSTRRMFNMFGYCGISSVILGVVFGGWFGDMPYAIMTGFLGYETTEAAKAAAPFFNGLVAGGVAFNPLENPLLFLIISLIMGAIHLIAGMAIKFVLLCREGKVFAAVFDIGSYWVLFAGLGLLVLNPLVGGMVAGVGALMIVATYGRDKKNILMKFLSGLKGLYDLINYASDLLSYCRILALGLAASVVGQVVNLLATMGGPTPGGFVLVVVVMLIGHLLNMAINVLGAFVHTSRLQYLEFFGKFYEDGGLPFQPALPSEQYSKSDEE